MPPIKMESFFLRKYHDNLTKNEVIFLCLILLVKSEVCIKTIIIYLSFSGFSFTNLNTTYIKYFNLRWALQPAKFKGFYRINIILYSVYITQKSHFSFSVYLLLKTNDL